MALKRLVIVGAGGFAREVAWLIGAINQVTPTFEVVGFIVTDLTRLTVHDSKVLGDLSWLEANLHTVDALANGIGTPGARLRVATELEARFPTLEWPTLIHPSVLFDRSTATIGHGVILCAGVIGTVNLVVESFAMVNLACTLGHEAHLGRGSVLNPTVNISGGVQLGSGVLVGTGAQILQYVRVGEGATVGAGAVVTREVAPGDTVLGVPARSMEKKT
ncbi:MAG: hypothetical protein Q8L14_35635 [Myxococcales bacterium]|nr:hypothetical protein [Myxococcales bacterium]